MSSKRRKEKEPKKGSAAASPSSTSAAAHVASIATVTNVLARPGLGAYNNVNEADLDRELANLEEAFASAAVRPPKTIKESLKSLAETSKTVASLTAAATRSPSPKHFERIAKSLAASTTLALELTLISKEKAKLESDYELARSIIKDILHLSPSARCGVMTPFLHVIRDRVIELSRKSGKYVDGTTRKLLNLTDASLKTSCAHYRTDREFLSYLNNVMGTLFDKDFFNEGTIDRSGKHQLEALYNHLWEETTKTGMGKAFVKRGGSRTKRRRRMNRTRKI
jgi:hypothetical protein